MKTTSSRLPSSTRLIKCIAIGLLSIVVVGLGTAKAEDPKIDRVEFFSHTNDDNKDHDTGVYVYVHSKDGKTELAKIENADNSPNDDTEYNDGSDHTLKLVVINTGARKSDCADFKVTVKQRTNGNDTWKFNGKVTIFFTDGTTLVKSKDGIILKNNDASDGF